MRLSKPFFQNVPQYYVQLFLLHTYISVKKQSKHPNLLFIKHILSFTILSSTIQQSLIFIQRNPRQAIDLSMMCKHCVIRINIRFFNDFDINLFLTTTFLIDNNCINQTTHIAIVSALNRGFAQTLCKIMIRQRRQNCSKVSVKMLLTFFSG